MKDKMKAWLLDYLKSNQQPTRRKKLNIQQLEEYLINHKFKDSLRYQTENGYALFVRLMNEISNEGLISPIKKSTPNGRIPSLHTEWWLEKAPYEQQWSDMQIMAVSDFLNLTKYRLHPEWQTVQEWAKIQSIYQFLKKKDQYKWVTREERSLQLFGEEKFLANEGTALLQRLQLSLDDLNAKVYGEPFAFWPAPNTDIRYAKTVLVVENQSFYHTCRILINSGKDIIGIKPDLLIYGEGKKIEKSFRFLRDITSNKDLSIYYVGDIDPEGWGIYVRLKEAFPDANIQLAVSIYEAMFNQNLKNQTSTNQNENRSYLEKVLAEFQQLGRTELAEIVNDLWEKKQRIPQEVLSPDTLGR